MNLNIEGVSKQRNWKIDVYKIKFVNKNVLIIFGKKGI